MPAHQRLSPMPKYHVWGARFGGFCCLTSPQFSTVEDAVHACILMHNLDVNGNLLYVTFSDAVPGL